MNFSFFIAKRYFLSGKKKNFIQWLTWISLVIVAICTTALIFVLSVFNGLEGLLFSLNSSFDPEIKIELTKGKSFDATEDLLTKVKETEGVQYVTEVIEDYAYIKYNDAEMVVTMKGVSDDFLLEKRIDESIVTGELKLKEEHINYAIIGQGVQYLLSVFPINSVTSLQVHYIKDIKRGTINTNEMYSKKTILPSSVFSIQKVYDESFIIVPISFASELLDYGTRRTSLEIKTFQGSSVEAVKTTLKNKLGSDFAVLDNQEQHADLYKLLKIEKLFVFIALTVILTVGSINILFVLSMLAIEKKHDIAVLLSLGIHKNTIRSIFLYEGIIISLSGAITGLVLGAGLCYLQQEFGFITMGMETAVQNSYPVVMKLTDFIYVGLCIFFITLLVSYRPAYLASKYTITENL
ncbi:MAG: FtsX-like permease family protein [Cyclobacteriaceae bacterium]|nr:FtsX-like permease family protein [Cyclobacteriaceae bacterium]